MAKVNIPGLSLRLANGIEPEISWEKIQTPHDLLLLAAKLLSVDVSQIATLEEVITSPTEPSGINKKPIWIKNENPFSISIKAGSQYISFYQYPPNIPLLWTKGKDSLPSHMRQLTEDEMQKFNLPEPADNFYFYAIFDL
jgi:hypothetical protein